MRDKIKKILNLKLRRLSKEEKQIRKSEIRNKYLNKKGFPQFWATHIFELIYILVVELIFKVLFNNLTWDYTILRILISSCIISFVLALVTVNMKQNIRKIVLILFNFIVVFYAWLQMGFVDFLGTFMSIGNAGQGTKITDYISDFLYAYNWKNHLLYIPFIISILYYIYELYIIKNGYNKKVNFKDSLSNYILGVYLALASSLFFVTLEADFMQNKFQAISNKSLFIYPINPSIAINNFGTNVYFLLDIKSTMFGGAENVYASGTNNARTPSTTREIDDSAWEELIQTETDKTLNLLNNYFINRKITEKNEYTGIFKDKNVIFIMLESVSQAVFSEEYKQYFPTLYKLYNEGITGINNYSPKNNCATGESEMTSQVSLYAISTACTVHTYTNNIYPEAIMSILSNNGYYTSAYHNYTDQYYSRSILEYNYGSSIYYGIDDLKMSYNNEYKEWPSDLEFMEKAIPKFIDQEKFASYMITVTAHTPYLSSSEMGDKYLSLFKDLNFSRDIKRYLSKIKVVDKAMEYLLNELEKSGKLDDTLLVIFGDHYPYGLGNSKYQKLANYDVSENQEIDRTPFIIYNSEVEPMTIDKITTPLDYAPTILNLLGIEYDPRHYMGNDIFSEYTDFAVFPDNSWQSQFGFYNAALGEFIPKNEDTSLTDEEIIAINTEVNDLRNMSALAIKKNYFKYLYDYFKEYQEKLEEVESTEEQLKTEE